VLRADGGAVMQLHAAGSVLQGSLCCLWTAVIPDELFMLMMGTASDEDGPAPAPAGGADAATPTTP
jgi:hypothetical protein